MKHNVSIYKNKLNIMTTQELFDQLEALYETFKAEHAKGAAGNKAAKGRARKAIGEMKKLVTPYRAASTAEDKK